MANLNELSNEQREEHYQKVCKAIGLDPELRLLDYIWMNDKDSGLRNLVLYARRGAAESLRSTRNISVVKTSREDQDGCTIFTVEGTDKTGRTEQAVGAAATRGLSGERLAYAIMTAHTRATRRLTLQFVTQGILDESEVNVPVTTDIATAASGAQLAGSPVVMPPPQVAPSAAPGKDITEKEAATIPNSHPFVISPAVSIPQTLPEFTAQQEKLRADAQAQLAAKTTEPVNAEPEPKRRTRRKRNQVDLASPGQTPAPPVPPAEPIVAPPARIETTVVQTQPATINVPALPAPPVQIQAPVVPTPAQPVSSVAPEKAKEYRERLAKYSQDILPKAGMMPSDGIGGVTMKLRKFAATFSGSNAQGLSEEQWEDLFDFIDGYSAKNGAPALVEYINKAIGVA